MLFTYTAVHLNLLEQAENVAQTKRPHLRNDVDVCRGSDVSCTTHVLWWYGRKALLMTFCGVQQKLTEENDNVFSVADHRIHLCDGATFSSLS